MIGSSALNFDALQIYLKTFFRDQAVTYQFSSFINSQAHFLSDLLYNFYEINCFFCFFICFTVSIMQFIYYCIVIFVNCERLHNFALVKNTS